MKVYPIDLYNGLLSTMNLDRQLGYIIPAMKKVRSPERTYSRVGYPKVFFNNSNLCQSHRPSWAREILSVCSGDSCSKLDC